MKNKDRYYDLLKVYNGQFNEIDLGEKMGLNEDETQAVISQLLSEYKIEYNRNGACNYSVFSKAGKQRFDP